MAHINEKKYKKGGMERDMEDCNLNLDFVFIQFKTTL